MTRLLLFFFALSIVTSVAAADELVVPIFQLTPSGQGAQLGTVRAYDSGHGLRLDPELKNLPPGLHGFHVHQNPDCGPGKEGEKAVPGKAAGDHLDPAGSKHHGGPYGEGHLGDLPGLFVAADGTATQPVLAPRLKVKDLRGGALVIHEGGDTYSDKPELGGGGARIACGIAKGK